MKYYSVIFTILCFFAFIASSGENFFDVLLFVEMYHNNKRFAYSSLFAEMFRLWYSRK